MFGRWNRLGEIYDFIARSPRGKVWVDDHLARIALDDVRVRYMDHAIKRKLVEGHPGRGDPVAGFLYVGRFKTIYVDPSSELGVLAPVLVHEMAHSTDAEYLASRDLHETLQSNLRSEATRVMEEASRRTGIARNRLTGAHCSPADLVKLKQLRDACEKFDHIRTFKSEARAYAEQYRVTLELVRLYPDYGTYLRSKEKQGFILIRPLKASDIIGRYGLNPKYFRPEAVRSPAA